MNILKINTKNGYFEIKNVQNVVMQNGFLFVFYDNKKAKIPLEDIISLGITTEEDGE
jgi:hypothetical protein